MVVFKESARPLSLQAFGQRPANPAYEKGDENQAQQRIAARVHLHAHHAAAAGHGGERKYLFLSILHNDL
jgi:hypothetical protein